MATTKFKRVKGIGTTIRMGAGRFDIVSSNPKGLSAHLMLQAAGKDDLSALASVVCQLHGIRGKQPRVGGKFAKAGA